MLGEPPEFSVVFGDKLSEPATLQWVKSMRALTCYQANMVTDTAKQKSLGASTKVSVSYMALRFTFGFYLFD